MKKYSEYFSINRNFQSSINLELDLDNENKIKEYVPTADICTVLKIYFKAFNGGRKDHATMLVGPYGKGKSFLLLVLSFLVNHEVDDVYRELLKKISVVDPELEEQITVFNKKGRKLLPIIINSNYDDIQQAFMIGLNEALNRASIIDIVPETVFDVCKDLLEKWQKVSDVKKRFDTCAKKYHTNYQKLLTGLNDYSPEAYATFTSVYNCITPGLEFNPLVNNDLVKIYNSVNHQLVEKHHYSGVFIIFDEFSKFIESSDKNLMRDLKFVQDVAELAARSGKMEQINFCCVTHKSLDLYNQDSNKVDAIKTVEGRFKEIKFNRSLDQNYELISASIKRKTGADKLMKDYISNHQDFYDAIQQSQPFLNQKYFETLTNGCFPLNPMTVYLLIGLSELVAQNERTLFTFLSDTDDHSLNLFLQRKDAENIQNETPETALFNADEIYEYFAPLLQKETTNNVRGIWYRAEGILSNLKDEEQRKIIRTLAVILMLDDANKIAPNDENIALAAGIELENVKAIIKDLIDEHFLRRNVISGLLSFAGANNKVIEDQINILIKTKGKSFRPEEILEEIDETKYLLPRRHNEKRKITRFYRVIYMTEEQFQNIQDFSTVKSEMFCDGIVVNLLRQKMSAKQIKDKIDGIEDLSVIVRYPKKIESYLFDLINRYAALKQIVARGGNEQIVNSELSLLSEEVTDDIRQLINDYFGEDCHFYSYKLEGKPDFTTFLSDRMDEIFNKNISFNNELINKNTVSSQYQKPANNVMQWLMDDGDLDNFPYSETSPEGTIKDSVIKKLSSKENSDIPEVINGIKDAIVGAEQEREPVADIIKEYINPPYGIRKGVMQILVAEAISELSDNVLLYLENNEIDLNAVNLSKSINGKGNYYIGFAKGSKAQQDYLNKMMSVFGHETDSNFRNATKDLCNEYRHFFVGLPGIMRINHNDFISGINPKVNEFKTVFLKYNINPYEAVYTHAINVFGTYEDAYKVLSNFVNNWKEYLDSFKKEVCIKAKGVFGIDAATSLRTGIERFLAKELDNQNPVFDSENNRIYKGMLNLSYDDCEAISDLSNAAIGVYVEDWSEDRRDELIEALRKFKNALSGAKKIDTIDISFDNFVKEASAVPMSDMGSIMESTLQNTLDDFGSSVSNEEKVAVLSKMLNDIINSNGEKL